jgi:HEPN domain-containing protein/predicted nucleotidyltransferase
MKTSLDHLPEPKRAQIAAIAALLQAEAPVEMVILFGSYARGNWVEDLATGYRSDFDLLAVVATEQLARDEARWTGLAERARALSGGTPVTLIAHDVKELNQQIRDGQYFFVEIIREGVILHDSRRHQLAKPKVLGPKERLSLAQADFKFWFGSANEFWRGSGYYAGRGLGPQAAFLLHVSVERYFSALLLVFTGYKPKSHNLGELADQVEPMHPALAGALPRTQERDKSLFTLLKKAYIEARYSRSYRITPEELGLLRERVHDLAVRVRQACTDKLASFCGPEAVGTLLEVPSIGEVAELPDAPPLDDPAAFEAWRQALLSLSYERGIVEGKQAGIAEGKQAGIAEGKQAGIAEGKQAGITEGEARSLLTILAARGLSVDAEARAKIEACQDSAVLQRWIGRAMTVASTAELFAPDSNES